MSISKYQYFVYKYFKFYRQKAKLTVFDTLFLLAIILQKGNYENKNQQ